MSKRVTREAGTAVIDIDSSQPIEEQLEEPEVAAALTGSERDASGMEPVADILPGVVEGIPHEAEADAAEPDEPATDEPPEPAFLSRYKRPSESAKEHVLKRVMDGAILIEGGIWDDAGASWNGVKVVPVAWVISVAIEALPEPNAYSSEVRSGGHATVWTTCGNCSGTYPIEGSFGSEFKTSVQDGVPKRAFKATFKSAVVDHICGQAMLPLPATVPGQTVAFPDPVTEPAPERTTPIPFVPFEDVLKLVHRVEREELLADDERIGIPPEEEIATWSTDDLGLAYEFLWSVIHSEPERPPVPKVLLRPEPPVVATIDGEPVGCSHEGAGLPDCPVCHPELAMGDGASEGTGDPDGDLLP